MFGYFFDHIFIIAIFIYGVVMPVASYISRFSRNFFDYMGIPIASPGLTVGFLIVSLHHRWIYHHLIAEPPNFRLEELRELLTAIALFALMVESWRLYQRKKSHQN